MSEVQTVLPRRFKVASLRSSDRAGNSETALARLVGLGPLTAVRTSLGDFPAQTLRKGDRIRTKEGPFLPILSVKRMTFDEDFMRYHPGAQPVVIRAGAISPGMPKQDLVLAPNQRLDTSGANMPARLEKAIDLLKRPHVFRKPEQIITYTVINLGRPACINCDGVWVELPG